MELSLLVFLISDWRSVFVVISRVVDGSKLQWVDRNNLEIEAAFIALQLFAFFYLIGIDDNRVIAFGTYNGHDGSLQGFGPAARL